MMKKTNLPHVHMYDMHMYICLYVWCVVVVVVVVREHRGRNME